jgi:hypothetical protein
MNGHNSTILANRSSTQVECNPNPNENIDSIQNKVIPGKSKSIRVVLSLFDYIVFINPVTNNDA